MVIQSNKNILIQMLYLIILQAFLTVLYFFTAPFQINWLMGLVLSINLLALGALAKPYLLAPKVDSDNTKIARSVFTLTLVVLEILVLLAPEPVASDPILSLINDSETFVTGILVGVLWKEKFFKSTEAL